VEHLPIRVEIYTDGGIAVGDLTRAGHLREALEAGGSVRVEHATWHPLADDPAGDVPEMILALDDIHLATAEESGDLPVHAQWHDIVLDVGPYRVTGQLATMPGFDPGRALARPTGEFVQLRDVSVGLVADDADGLHRPVALVNRYVVDRVEADLMLGFFFPGAEMIASQVEAPAMFIPAASEAAADAATDASSDGGSSADETAEPLRAPPAT
jgi:hypothetical protein